MKHVMAAATYAGLVLDGEQRRRLKRYGDWLSTEAHRAGGIGPAELERLEIRHLADALLFACCFDHETNLVWDLGTGVGLPGIPLAIALPNTRFVLIDRSGRRIDLVKRATRILELENCQAIQGEIESMQGRTDVIVSRASLPPAELTGYANRYLGHGGVAVVGGSWRRRPLVEGWDTVEIPSDVLDQPIWLLIMRRA